MRGGGRGREREKFEHRGKATRRLNKKVAVSKPETTLLKLGLEFLTSRTVKKINVSF